MFILNEKTQSGVPQFLLIPAQEIQIQGLEANRSIVMYVGPENVLYAWASVGGNYGAYTPTGKVDSLPAGLQLIGILYNNHYFGLGKNFISKDGRVVDYPQYVSNEGYLLESIASPLAEIINLNLANPLVTCVNTGFLISKMGTLWIMNSGETYPLNGVIGNSGSFSIFADMRNKKFTIAATSELFENVFSNDYLYINTFTVSQTQVKEIYNARLNTPGVTVTGFKGVKYQLLTELEIQNQNKLTKLQDEIDNIVFPEPSPTDFYPRPPSGYVNFKVNVNTAFQNVNSITLDVQDSETLMDDWAVLFLPTSYDTAGGGTRLIISCHGAGTTINDTTSSLSQPVPDLLKMGYAVLDCNGVPASLSGGTGLHYGSPYALESYLAAYKWAIQRYNLKRDGIFVLGTSMGGLTSNMLVQSDNLPVLAQVGFCPAVDHYKQAYCQPWSAPASERSQIAKLFGFTGTAPVWTSNPYPSQDEINYYMSNIDKIIGYNPIMKNTYNWKTLNIYNYPNDTEGHREAESNIYNQLIKYHNAPLKIFHNVDDPTVSIRYSEFFVNAIQQCGGLAYLRKFPSGGHNAWYNGATTNVTGVDGETFAMAASAYEAMLFLQRFE